jgi:hypothetical protein
VVEVSLARVRKLASLTLAIASISACAPALPRQAPGKPPTPKTVTRANPGGDADDPELAALERLASESWGTRKDRWNTLHVSLVDRKHWRRVRLWGYPMRASYRYGDDHYAVATIWYEQVEGPTDPESCLAKFLEFAMPVAKKFEVKMGPQKSFAATQTIDGEDKPRPMAMQVMDGSLDTLLKSDDYVGALAAYQSWPGTCLVQGFAVVATEHRELAVKIRDRWVAEGAPRLVWDKKVTEAPPPLKR